MKYLLDKDERIMKSKTVKEILINAKLDWQVIQEDLFLEDGTQIPNTKVNLKSDTRSILGIVSDRYEVVQNEVAFDFVNEMLKDKLVPEYVGEINDSKIVFLKTDLKNIYCDCFNKNVDCKLIFTNQHDGKGSVRINIIPIIEGVPFNLKLHHKRNWNAVHSKTIEKRMEFAKQTLKTTNSYLQELMEETIRLSKVTFTEKQKDMFIKLLFPMNPNLSEKQYENAEEEQNALKIHIQSNTAFGFLMGVSSYINNLKTKRQTKTFEKKQFLSVITGYSLFDRAYDIISKSI